MNEISNLFAVAVIVVTALAIIIDCRRDVQQLVSARNAFLLTLVMWYLLEAIIIPAEVAAFGQDGYDFGVICIAVSIATFLLSYHLSRGGVFDPLFARLAHVDNPDLIWRIFILAAALGFLPLMWVAEGNPMVIIDDALNSKGRWSSVFTRGRYGGVRDAFLELQMFLRAAIPISAAIAVQKRQPTLRRVVGWAFLFFMFMRGYNNGTRSKVLEVFLPLVGCVYWTLPGSIKRKALIVGVPAFAALGVIWSAGSVIGRNEGTVKWDEATEADYVGFEMFRELLYMADVVPRTLDYRMGRTYFVQLVNPIPRAIWPDKPIDDAGLELAKVKGLIAHGDAYLTVSPGLLGEMYWNFGMLGIGVISAILGYLAKSWDRIRYLAQRSIIAFTVFAAGLAVIFLSGRSINMATLYGMLALFVLLIMFSKPEAVSRREHVVNNRSAGSQVGQPPRVSQRH